VAWVRFEPSVARRELLIARIYHYNTASHP